MKALSQPRILLFGNDTTLAYLIGRYAGLSGLGVTSLQGALQPEDVRALKPEAVLFTSVESLAEARKLVAGLGDSDIPILVCSSVADVVRSRELGADNCLLHPLTYEGFQDVLEASNIRLDRKVDFTP